MTTKLSFFTLKKASLWASEYLKKNVTPSNIAYLVQYGIIPKHGDNGVINKQDLIDYYQKNNSYRKIEWTKKLGKDLNWRLSFDNLKEKDTTKHVHRLHPYKGKFIPQLVEYFIDEHTDKFKTEKYFNRGDIILDPFAGSGTTMVQANELGMHAIGVDISAFNSLIANVKVAQVDFINLQTEIKKITTRLQEFTAKNSNLKFENELLAELHIFNKKHFPAPEYKRKIRQKELLATEYTPQKVKNFNQIFDKLQKKYQLKNQSQKANNFLAKWYLKPVKSELAFTFNQLQEVTSPTTKKILTIILSRTMRSCRATTHADLATLKQPINKTYYCQKHGKICKPLFSILSWWERYSKDTTNRFLEFSKLKTNTFQNCLQGDSRTINLFEQLLKKNSAFSKLAQQQKINGIFSSPPYVGLIDYHEQHAYAYDLFKFNRNDELEIGPLYKGQGQAARNSYIEGIAQVLKNSKSYLQQDYNILLVANDKHNIYPTIAEKSGMRIINQYKRPVLNRTEKDKSAYSEIIFHLKSK